MQTSTSSSKRALFSAALAVFLLGGGESAAWADDESVFQEHYQRGLQLYKLNALRPAIKEFTAAYAANPLPRLLYNLGQLQRKVGDYRDAIDSYELYLRTETELTAERKKEINVYLEAMRAATSSSTPAAPASQEPAPATPKDPKDSKDPKDPKDPKEAAPPSASDVPLLLVLPPVQSGKAGRTMFNVGIGYNYPFFDASFIGGLAGLVVRPEMGFAVNHSRNAYLIFSPQFVILQNNYQVAVTVGFQYDFPILVRGLFLHMTGSAGYAVHIINNGSGTLVLSHGGVATPELGFKYVVSGRVNFGFHPVSLPISFDSTGVAGSFRTTFYGGYNF